MADAKGKINQLTKTMDDANGKIVRLEDKNDQLTQKLKEARGTIVAMKRDMNQMNKDLQLLLRQSTFDGKGPAASNGQSVPSGDETVFSLILRNQIYYNLLLMVSIVFERNGNGCCFAGKDYELVAAGVSDRKIYISSVPDDCARAVTPIWDKWVRTIGASRKTAKKGAVRRSFSKTAI